jgi:hypothetical protein
LKIEIYVFKNEFAIGVYEDNSGMPDLFVGSANGFAPKHVYPNWLPSGLTTVEFDSTVLIENGKTYWIGVHPAHPEPTDLAWVWNYLDDGLQSIDWFSTTPSEVLFGGNWEGSALRTESAYRVNGTPVPITGAVWLLGSGLLGLAGLKRKFLNKRREKR